MCDSYEFMIYSFIAKLNYILIYLFLISLIPVSKLIYNLILDLYISTINLKCNKEISS